MINKFLVLLHFQQLSNNYLLLIVIKAWIGNYAHVEIWVIFIHQRSTILFCELPLKHERERLMTSRSEP